MIEYTKEQLNYLKFTSFVNSELLKALRKAFKAMWDEKYGPSEIWNDSERVRKSFLSKEGGAASTKVPYQISYEEWDCTVMCQATIYAKSFANSTGQTLHDLYLRPLGLPSGRFHSFVVSPRGDPEETRALAIDQLRRLRNSQAHPTNDKMDKGTFDLNVHRAKQAFQALGIRTNVIEELGNLPESELPTSQNTKLRRQRDLMAVGVGVVLLN
ncbi:uncharacterized protein LOC122947665 [Acropora millepora]|uniref:uncharacterized protein LOC122947665 n=1 Tax=Acropora millepora TaxID=45264 RepID=UPI001CF185B2|nr:uncharacterized protein LOC122947665 [Acropora millepora]